MTQILNWIKKVFKREYTLSDYHFYEMREKHYDPDEMINEMRVKTHYWKGL